MLHCDTVPIMNPARKADTTTRVEYWSTFEKKRKKKKISVDDLDDLTQKLQANPKVGTLIPGSGGARKLTIHWRGGSRVIYYYDSGSKITVFQFYLKSEQKFIGPPEKAVLKQIIKALK